MGEPKVSLACYWGPAAEELSEATFQSPLLQSGTSLTRGQARRVIYTLEVGRRYQQVPYLILMYVPLGHCTVCGDGR